SRAQSAAERFRGTVQSAEANAGQRGGTGMFSGEPGIWPLPGGELRAQDSHSGFWRGHAGQAEPGARGSGSGLGDSASDDGAADDVGYEAGLCDRRELEHREWWEQRLKLSIAESAPVEAQARLDSSQTRSRQRHVGGKLVSSSGCRTSLGLFA